SRDVEEGAGNRIEVAVDLGEFVPPPGVPDEGVDRLFHLSTGPTPVRIRDLDLAHECLETVLDHLGHPVEDLAAVVSGAGRPSRLSLASVADGHAQVLAGGLGDPGHDLATGVVSRKRPARLGAWKVTPEERKSTRLKYSH